MEGRSLRTCATVQEKLSSATKIQQNARLCGSYVYILSALLLWVFVFECRFTLSFLLPSEASPAALSVQFVRGSTSNSKLLKKIRNNPPCLFAASRNYLQLGFSALCILAVQMFHLAQIRERAQSKEPRDERRGGERPCEHNKLSCTAHNCLRVCVRVSALQ